MLWGCAQAPSSDGGLDHQAALDSVRSDLESARTMVQLGNESGALGKLRTVRNALQSALDSGERLSTAEARQLSTINGTIVGYSSNTDVTVICGQIGELIVRVTQ